MNIDRDLLYSCLWMMMVLGVMCIGPRIFCFLWQFSYLRQITASISIGVVSLLMFWPFTGKQDI